MNMRQGQIPDFPKGMCGGKACPIDIFGKNYILFIQNDKESSMLQVNDTIYELWPTLSQLKFALVTIIHCGNECGTKRKGKCEGFC